MGTKVPAWPTLESDVLKALVAAFRRRSKAIKHQVSSWEIDSDVEAESEMDLVGGEWPRLLDVAARVRPPERVRRQEGGASRQALVLAPGAHLQVEVGRVELEVDLAIELLDEAVS